MENVRCAGRTKEKARKFKQHREAHYNEFKALQEWRDKRAGDMMDDDSDSEDEGDTAEVHMYKKSCGQL